MTVDGALAWLDDPAAQRLRAWTVYLDDQQDNFVLGRIVPVDPEGDGF